MTDIASSALMMMIINKHRNLSEKTEKYYKRSLEKIMRDCGLTEYRQIIEHPAPIIEFLKTKKIPYQMNLICIITVLLDSFKKYQMDLADKSILIPPSITTADAALVLVRQRQAILKTKLHDSKCSITKSVSQADNWCSYEDLRKCLLLREKNAKKIIKRGIKTIKDLLEIQKWVICGLYVGDKENPPLRLDFINMSITTNNFYLESPHQNFLYCQSLRTKKFVLGEYKTSSKYGIKQIPLRPYLNRMINTWISARNEMKEAFEPTGKHITANLIRHIYITDMTQNLSAEERKRIAGLMCHNLEMQINYIKQ